ncbi:MAG TPA: response regulator transcription factor [Pseudonocardiaceae bacterium]|jgi:two-component system response regulator MprA|nr:response regulator transcription factor [Pseudonocardiaceae bacterium]
MRVLVVDDEPAVRESISRSLRFEGYQVELASDGNSALDTVRTGRPDVVILDVMMPGLDGLETCRRLRAIGDRVPVLMLTARRNVGDRVAGLDAGADDYLVKPFALEELLARVRALLRRVDSGTPEALSFADLEVNPATHTVTRNGRVIDLTKTEFELLTVLLRSVGRVVTRSVLFLDVWGYDFGNRSNSLDVYIGYLRRKLEADGEPRLVHTVRGVGYVLREVDSSS